MDYITRLVLICCLKIVKENKEAYKRLGYDSGGLITVIWLSFKKAEDPEKWLSAGMQDILEDISQYDQLSWSYKLYTDH